MVMKLIDASDVVSRGSVKKIPIKIEKKDVVKGGGLKLVEPSNVSVETTIDVPIKNDETSVGPDNKKVEELPKDTVARTIIAIKLKQEDYYGPVKNNKNKFMRMYKDIGLSWKEQITVGNELVDGWFNKDKSQYIIKLPEEGDYKRFKFSGCDEIYDYFVKLGAATFDYIKENVTSPTYNNASGATNVNSPITNVSKIGTCTDEDDRFIGADLWSGYRTRQLLKGMPDNWGVIWK